jgi:hypothetical protein
MRLMHKMMIPLTLLLATPIYPAAESATTRERARKVPVESNVFDAYRYSPSQKTLTLWFDNGSVYRYADVPEAVVRDFHQVVNKGRFFHQNIRKTYVCAKVAPAGEPAPGLADSTR